MVRRNAFRWTLATLVLLGTRAASADPITLTGNVANDFADTNQNVHINSVDPNPLSRITQPSIMGTTINGWAIKDLRTSYDASTDTLSVGVNTYSTAGDATGNGDPGVQNYLTSHGFINPASFGVNGPFAPNGTPLSDKSITVGFAGNNLNDVSQAGSLVMVAGVPAMKPAPGTAGYGLDDFTVAKYAGNTNQQIQNNYGAPMLSNLGSLAFDPNPNQPGFEFTIKNFSKISPALDPTQGFWVQVYAGSGQDGPIGEEASGFIHVPPFPQAQNIPEPTTWLAWSVVAGIATLRLRRRAKV